MEIQSAHSALSKEAEVIRLVPQGVLLMIYMIIRTHRMLPVLEAKHGCS